MESRAKSESGGLDTRARIVAVATELFARQGYSGVGMRMVSERTGLSKSALFHHFPTKLALYGAVLCGILEALEARSRVVDDSDDPMEQLRLWVGGVIDLLAENRHSAPLLLRALFDEEPLQPDDARRTGELIAAAMGRAHDLLTRGMETGRFRRVSRGQTVQSAIGMTIYHFASGEFGDRLMGESMFAPEQVERRKKHVVHVLEQLLRVDG